MQSQVLNIIRLIHQISGSSMSYLLRASDEGRQVISSYGNIPADCLNAVNNDIVQTGLYAGESLIATASFNELGGLFPVKSAYVYRIFAGKEEENPYILVLLAEVPEHFTPAVVNNIKPLESYLEDFLRKNFTEGESIDLRRIFSEVDMGMIIHETTGRILSINHKGMELLNIGPEDVKVYSRGHAAFNFYDEDGQLIPREEHPQLKALSQKSNVIDRPVKYLDTEGNTSWLRVNSFLIKDDDGNVTEVLSTFTDITAIMNIEESLKNTTKSIESILYSSDANGYNYYFITDAVKKLLGFSPGEIINNSKLILRRIHPEDFQRFKEFTKKLQSGKPAVVEHRMKDFWGNEHYLRNSAFPVLKGDQIIRIDGVIVEVTSEKKMQLELEKSEERFRLLIETANDLIFNLDSGGYFLMVNNYGALALGYRPGEMIGRHFLEFIDEDAKAAIALAFQKILKADKVISFDVVFKDKFGKSIVFEIQGRPTTTDGSITGMLGIGRDITQRRKDEEKLRELNAKLIEANRLVSIERDRAKQQVSILEELNKLKSDFISNISHELRTPLASVVGFSETITGDPDMPKEMVLEFSNIILSEGKRLAKLINDVLDFAKMEAGEVAIFKAEFDIVQVLTEIVENSRPSALQKGIILTTDIPESAIMLSADKDRVTQVYQHLITNAIKFTNKGGRITVIAQNFLKEFEVIVSDTGMGIPSKDLPNIFQKFFKAARPGTQIPGTGIGLGLVKQIVDLHKGLITVQSEINKGTTFIVKLPKRSIN